MDALEATLEDLSGTTSPEHVDLLLMAMLAITIDVLQAEKSDRASGEKRCHGYRRVGAVEADGIG